MKKKSFAEQKQYIYKYIKQATTQLAIAMKDKNVKLMIDTKAREAKTKDYNVPLKDLMNLSLFTKHVNMQKLQESMDAFKGIRGKDLQLQVYVPWLDYADGKITQIDTDEDIEYVIPDGDENELVLEGYELGLNDDLVLSGRMINEDYANNKPVYLLYFNESDYGDNSGGGSGSTWTNNLPPSITEGAPDNPPTNPGSLNFRVDEMIVKNLNKESWWKGRPEISIMGDKYTWNGIAGGASTGQRTSYHADITPWSTHGQLMIRPDRKDCNPNAIHHPNYSMDHNWIVDYSNIYSQPVIMAYSIFEEDSWPSPNQIADIHCYLDVPQQYERNTYCSSDSAYINWWFYNTKYTFPAGHVIPSNTTYYTVGGTFKEDVRNEPDMKYNITQYYY